MIRWRIEKSDSDADSDSQLRLGTPGLHRWSVVRESRFLSLAGILRERGFDPANLTWCIQFFEKKSVGRHELRGAHFQRLASFGQKRRIIDWRSTCRRRRVWNVRRSERYQR